MYSQIDAATRPKANPERPATNAPAKVAKRNNGISKGIPSMARSIEKRAALAWGHHLTGRLRHPRRTIIAEKTQRAQRSCPGITKGRHWATKRGYVHWSYRDR